MERRLVVPSRGVLLAAAFIATACGGGGSSPSSPSYPAVKGTCLAANGRVTVQCDDGRAMTIEEQLTGKLPVPPSTPG